MALIPVTNVLSQDQDAFKVQTNGIYDNRGNSADVTSFGDVVQAHRMEDISVSFHNDTPPTSTTAVTGTGTAAVSGIAMQLNAGTGVGTGTLRSVDGIRFKPGNDSYVIFTAVFGAPEANVDSKAGVWDETPDQGFYFGYEDTTFGIWDRGTHVPQASWNGDQLLGVGGSATLAPATINTYRIVYNETTISYEITLDNGRHWTVCHTADLRNSGSAPVNTVASLLADFEVSCTTSNVTNPSISVFSFSAGTISTNGMASPITERYYSIDGGETIISAGIATNVLTVRNPATYNGKPNRMKSQLLLVSATTDGNQSVKIETRRNATIGGTQNFQPVGTNSQLEYDVDGTTVTGGDVSFPIYMAKSDSQTVYAKDQGLFLRPGEEVTFTAISGATNTVTIAIRERSTF